MLVRSLTADRFRNLRTVTFAPHPRFNVLSGDNGQGKTNLLEAIYLLSTLRSFRTARIEELVRFGEAGAGLRALVEHQRVQRVLGLDLGVKPTRKTALVDGKAARASDYFSGVNVVLFAPEDLRLPKGPPVLRRRFLDRAVWNTCPAYLEEVRTYERVLRSRNALLRDPRHAARKPAEDDDSALRDGRADALPAGLLGRSELFEIYDQQLATAGAVLMRRRRAYIAQLAPQVATTFDEVSRSGLVAELRYTPGVGSQRRAMLEEKDAPIAEILREQLTRDRRRDELRGYTHSGPHADDLALDLDGRPADIHASQGQTRALVLSLKIAEINHLYRVLGDAPVLLLDDVSSELDAQRNAHLFEFLRAVPCQVFITTTSPVHVQLPQTDALRRDFAVEGGSVRVTAAGAVTRLAETAGPGENNDDENDDDDVEVDSDDSDDGDGPDADPAPRAARDEAAGALSA